MTNRNLDNSKKITHLVGQFPRGQLKNRPPWLLQLKEKRQLQASLCNSFRNMGSTRSEIFRATRAMIR